MAKRKINVTTNAFEDAAGVNYKKDPITISWNGIEIQVKPVLTFYEVVDLVRNVTESCFLDDNEYHPEIRQFAVRRYVIDYYTNIRLPENLEHCYALLMESSIYKVVRENINEEQFMMMLDAIEEKIRVMIQISVSSAQAQTHRILQSVDALTQQMDAVFGNITDVDMKNIIGALNNGKIDEKKLVDAYFANKKEDEA